MRSQTKKKKKWSGIRASALSLKVDDLPFSGWSGAWKAATFCFSDYLRFTKVEIKFTGKKKKPCPCSSALRDPGVIFINLLTSISNTIFHKRLVCFFPCLFHEKVAAQLNNWSNLFHLSVFSKTALSPAGTDVYPGQRMAPNQIQCFQHVVMFEGKRSV